MTDSVETGPPPEPEETDLIEGAVPTAEAPAPTTTPPAQPGTGASACEKGYRYYPTEKYGKKYHKGVGITQANTNDTSRTAQSTFTSTATGKVTVAYSGELKVSASVAVAEIEGKFGVNLAVELTAMMGNTVSVETPPHVTTNARYGVYRFKSKGYSQYVYLNCTRGVKNNVTIYTPRKVGWHLWED